MRTSDYYTTRLSPLRRQSWAPAVLNQAFVLALQAQYAAARGQLDTLLGVDKAQENVPPVAGPDVEAIKSYVLAMPLGTSSTTIARVVTSAFGRLEPATVQTLVRALDHARLEMSFIDEIVRGLTG